MAFLGGRVFESMECSILKFFAFPTSFSEVFDSLFSEKKRIDDRKVMPSVSWKRMVLQCLNFRVSKRK